MTTLPPGKVYTVSQVAGAIGKPAKTIRNHCADGTIKATFLPDLGWVIDEETVQALTAHWPFRAGNPKIQTLRGETLQRAARSRRATSPAKGKKPKGAP